MYLPLLFGNLIWWGKAVALQFFLEIGAKHRTLPTIAQRFLNFAYLWHKILFLTFNFRYMFQRRRSPQVPDT